MITQVSLKGFQSHINSEFNLDQGLNVITGPSDAGKTAIIRAVRWVAFNEPKGEAFVNENVGSAEVKIQLENGTIITKIRKSSKTSYIIQQDDSDEGSFFEKSEVPAEVTSLLGIEKHSFGDFESALNFSFQLDTPFLISETASAGAKVLGKLAGTESVDRAIKGVSKDTYAARNLRTQAEKDMERITGSLFEYEGIDDAKASLETAEMLLEQVESNKDKLDDLKNYRHEYLLNRDKLQNLSEQIDKLAHVPDLVTETQEIETSQQRYEQLLQLKDDGNRLVTRISSLEQQLETYKEVPIATDHLNSIIKDVDQLTNNINLRQSYQKYAIDVKKADETLEKVREIDTAAGTVSTAEKDISSLNELRTLESEYKLFKDKLSYADSRLNKFEDLKNANETLTVADNDVERFAALKELQKEFNLSFTRTDEAITADATATNAVQKAELDLQQAWDEAGGVCPLCESVVCEHDATR